MNKSWLCSVALIALTMSPGTALGLGETEVVTDAGLITDGPKCSEFTTRVFDTAADQFYTADLRACPGGIFDLTKGDDRPHVGQEMVYGAGHAEGDSPWKFIRAYPNKAYAFTGWRDETLAKVIGSDTPPSWDATNTALPFSPQRVFRTTDQEQYHYTDFVILDADAAYPLNANSVLVALDGYLFLKPTGLLDALSKPIASQYREVWYYQRDGQDTKLKRAFIRNIRRDQMAGWSRSAPGWAGSVPAVAAKQDDDSDLGNDLLKGLLVFGAILIASELVSSDSSGGYSDSGSSSDGGPSSEGGGGGSSYKPPPADPVETPDAIDPFYDDCHGGPANCNDFPPN